MKIKYMPIIKFILVLVICILVCWADAGSASEQWDARTSARVNLRRHPGPNGVILSIVPKGYKIRIMEEDGPWYKVDVEGKIHGKGWVYAEYVEKIIRKTVKTGSTLENVRSETASGAKRKEGTQTAEPPTAAVSTKTERVRPLGASLPGNTSIAVANEQSSARIELRKTGIETGDLSKAEISSADDSAYIAPSQAPLEVQRAEKKAKPINAARPVKFSMAGMKEQQSMRDELRDAKNESNALSQAVIPMAGEPVHKPSAQSPHPGFKQDALGISKKYFSGVIEPKDAAPYQKGLPGEKKKDGGAVRETPFPVSDQAVPDVRAVAASLEKSALPLESKRPITRPESMGPVKVILKLLSIVLSCLVILLLYMENKTVTQPYRRLWDLFLTTCCKKMKVSGVRSQRC